jgi:23S rRNA (uridine2552-2'-O)-methyltransferase
MNRSRSSNAWLREHVTDTYVQRARAEGYRSRAAYKLLEMDQKDHLIRAGDVVVDLGAAPGGWSQVAAKKMQGKGRIIAVDLLEMEPAPASSSCRGIFVSRTFSNACKICSLAPGWVLFFPTCRPISLGIALCDQARGTHLAELAVDFARTWLKPDGALLVKVFQGHGFNDVLMEMRKTFKVVSSRKPDASRDRSPEVYLLGRTLKV